MGSGLPKMGARLSGVEKRWFPWRRNNVIAGRPVFFPGCNLVNFLPRTARVVTNIVSAQGDGWLYDCCGKPLMMGRDAPGANAIVKRTRNAMLERGATELVLACPNCLEMMKKHLGLPVKDIYTYLRERNIQWSGPCEGIRLFTPCPDRAEGAIARSIESWSGQGVSQEKGLPCCGLGEKVESSKFRFLAEEDRMLTPACASCSGQLQRMGIALTPHALAMGLGVDEPPSSGVRVGLNRLKPMGW